MSKYPSGRPLERSPQDPGNQHARPERASAPRPVPAAPPALSDPPDSAQEFEEFASAITDLTARMHEILARMSALEDRLSAIKNKDGSPPEGHELRIADDHAQDQLD